MRRPGPLQGGLHGVSNAHPDADALSHAISPVSDADAFSDANTTSYSFTNPNSISHAYSNTDADTNAHSHSNTDSNSNSKASVDSKRQAGGQPLHLRHSGI